MSTASSEKLTEDHDKVKVKQSEKFSILDAAIFEKELSLSKCISCISSLACLDIR